MFMLVAWEKASPWNHPTVAGSGWVTVLALCTHFQGLAASARSAGNKARRWDCLKLREKLVGKAWRILGWEAALLQNMPVGGVVIGSIHCALDGRRGSEVCMAGLGLSGKWCPHRRKRRKQLEGEEPKSPQKRKKLEACFCSVLGWGCEPCQWGGGDLEGESHLLRLIAI